MYRGPFLLPIIDLLNHSSIENKKCTTLRRDTSSSNGGFYMIAERHIIKGEEILGLSDSGNCIFGKYYQNINFIKL